MKRVRILTPYPLDPIHPRTEMVREVAAALGHEVRISERGGGALRVINALTLGFFDLDRSLAGMRDLRDVDVVYVQDLRLIPAVLLAKLRRKLVVYETLDRGVALHGYQLARRWPWTRWLRALYPLLEWLERRIAGSCATAVVVNSRALAEYLAPGARLLYYASPLEDLPSPPAGTEPALLYLGAFSRDKGASDALRLCEELSLPLFVFGTVSEAEIRDRIAGCAGVTTVPRLESSRLKERLAEQRERYRFLGLSLIRPVHLSYATQEANKDIDYLALGIPILGNRRLTTADKIEAGCGVFAEDLDAVRRLVDDPARYLEVAESCRGHYRANYARAVFEQRLRQLFEELEHERSA